MRAGEVATRAGVNIELFGIDRWVGGAHLTPEQVWRWDPSAQLFIAP
jgi:hypothetical protein